MELLNFVLSSVRSAIDNLLLYIVPILLVYYSVCSLLENILCGMRLCTEVSIFDFLLRKYDFVSIGNVENICS
jgi:hypothetical protein